MEPYRATEFADAVDDSLPVEFLGRKGVSTRRKLMASACELLAQHSAVGLTSSAIAQGAGVSPASFYNYFANVEAIIHALCLEATAEAQVIIDSIRPGPGESATAVARRFVAAYNDHWHRFRPILSVRNMEADRGNKAFQFLRRGFINTLMAGLLDVAVAFRPEPADCEIEKLRGRIGVAVAAIERLAAAEGLYLAENATYPLMPRDVIRNAQIELLASILDPRVTLDEAMRDEFRADQSAEKASQQAG